MKNSFVYIAFNRRNVTLYTGVTSNLVKRIHEHKTKVNRNSFTAKYNVDRLGYFEVFQAIRQAIAREKQIKAGSGQKKLALIEKGNPEWRDLYEEII